MLPAGLERHRLPVGDVALHVATGGSGPPLLLLHGYPQSHLMWHRVAPALMERHTLVIPDLRGYGDSDKPPGDPQHARYAKRTMAADLVALMDRLGHRRFQVAGHDRGARVTHRLCLDWPARVERAALLDIVPTLTLFERLDQRIAADFWHWLFLSRPAPFPETVIAGAPEYFMRHVLGPWTENAEAFPAPVVDQYLRCFTDPATIHASCEDYRAGASIDLDHHRADRAAGRRVTTPLLVLWGTGGRLPRHFDVPDCWRAVATTVQAVAVDCGHFIPEEAPAAVIAAFQSFFRS